MIRVFKSDDEPTSLEKKNSYNGKDVHDRLFEDQHGKCYICERIVGTDFEVEHHKSQSHFPALMYDWHNLFLSCSYCNRKKNVDFDNMLNPETENIEEMIRQEYDFSEKKFIFTSECHDERTASTLVLLDRIFNGTGRMRTKREEAFRKEVWQIMNPFLNFLRDYLHASCEKNASPVHEALSVYSPLLGLKYWCIKLDGNLEKNFMEDIKWNKK